MRFRPFLLEKAAMSEPKPDWSKFRELEPPVPESPRVTMASYTALVILVGLFAGMATVAFPYVLAWWSDGDRHYDVRGTDFDHVATNDTKSKAWWRFAAGTLGGSAAMVGYLVYQKYKRDNEIVERDPFLKSEQSRDDG